MENNDKMTEAKSNGSFGLRSSRDYLSVFNPGKLWRPNRRCSSCIYRAGNRQSVNGCDYALITGKCRTAEIDDPELLHPSKCPLYVKGVRQNAVDHIPLTDKNRGRIKHEEFKRLWEQGATDKELANTFGVSPITIGIYRRKRGYACNVEQKTVKPQYNYETMEQLYYSGKWDKEIAEELGCCISTVIAWRRRKGYPSQLERTSEMKNRRYRELYERGICDKEIAEAVGVSVEAVKQWRRKNGSLPPNKRKDGDEVAT